MEIGTTVRCFPTGKIYPSLSEASKDTKDSITAIRNCCNGKTQHTRRYKWEYVGEVEVVHRGKNKNKIRNRWGEVWKPIEIEGFEGLYSISNLGRVKSHFPMRVEKIIEPLIMKKEKERNDTTYFATVVLHNNTNTYKATIKNLVAQAFIPNPNNFTALRHKDGNQLNCEETNLEWYDPTDERSSRCQDNYYKYRDRQTSRKKPVRCIETGREFESLKEASRQTGINPSYLTQVCVGKAHTAGGYHWEFVNKEDNFLLYEKKIE